MSSSRHESSENPSLQYRTGHEAAADEGRTSSERADEIQRLKAYVEAAPELREERIAAVKQALLAGKLNLKGADLAEQLLQDILPVKKTPPCQHHPACELLSGFSKVILPCLPWERSAFGRKPPAIWGSHS